MENLPKPTRGNKRGSARKDAAQSQESKSKKAKKERPALRLDSFEGFLKAVEAMQGVHTVYVTLCVAPLAIMLEPGTLAFYLTAKDEQNELARCYLASRKTELDLHGNREATLLAIEDEALALKGKLRLVNLEMERGEWLA